MMFVNLPWCEKMIRYASLQIRFATDTLRYRYALLEVPQKITPSLTSYFLWKRFEFGGILR